MRHSKKELAGCKWPERITTDMLTEITGYTDVYHRQLGKKGYFPSPERGFYDTVVTLKGIIRHERDVREKASTPLAVERQRKMTVERKMLELQLSRANRESLDAREVEKEWEAMTLAIRQRLLGLSSRLGPRLPYCQSQKDMAAEIDKEVRAILLELSRPDSSGNGSVPVPVPAAVAVEGAKPNGKEPDAGSGEQA